METIFYLGLEILIILTGLSWKTTSHSSPRLQRLIRDNLLWTTNHNSFTSKQLHAFQWGYFGAESSTCSFLNSSGGPRLMAFQSRVVWEGSLEPECTSECLYGMPLWSPSKSGLLTLTGSVTISWVSERNFSLPTQERWPLDVYRKKC